MTQQLAYTLAAATIGFVSAILFCIGNAGNSAKQIANQATPYWDFSEPVARALAAQRAQYVTGALLLLISFGLQVREALASPTIPADLPQWIHTWHDLVLAVLLPTALVAAGFSFCLYKLTMRKVRQIAEAQTKEEKRQAQNRV